MIIIIVIIIITVIIIFIQGAVFSGALQFINDKITNLLR